MTGGSPGRTALVTGGAGFIGSRLTRKLAAQGWTTWVFDNLSPQVHGDAPNIVLLDGCRLVRGDMRDRDAVLSVVAECRPDLVVHLASETGTGQSRDEVARYCDVNVTGTAHLVEALRALPVTPGHRRVVLASSRAVYGEGAWRDAAGRTVVPPPRTEADMRAGRFAPVAADGTSLVPLPTPETTTPQPASIYASTKLMQEYLLRQALDEDRFEVVVLRFQNVYGPGQSLSNPYTGILSIFTNQIFAGGPVVVYEDGAITRDFVYVDDVVEAVLAAQAGEAVAGPVNIGGGEPATILGTARLLAELYDAGDVPVTVTGQFRVGDVRHAVADIADAARLLGWRPRTSLRDGLEQFVRWVREERAAA